MSFLRAQPAWRVVALIVASSAAAAGAARADSGPPMTLGDAVARALREGRDAKIARLETAQADAAVGQARSIYWPQAAASSNAGWSNRQDETINAINGRGELKRYPLSSLGSNAAWVSIYIDQVLFDLSRWRGVERTELEREAVAVQEAEQRERISLAVTEQYVNLLRLEQLAAVDAERVKQAEWLDRQAAALLDAGRTLEAEREQVSLMLEEARAQAAQRQQELDDARTALWRTIGGDSEVPPFELAPDSLPVAAPSSHASPDEAVRAAPELRVLELRRRMEETSLAAACAEWLPTLSLRGGYFHYGTKRFDSFESELAVGVDLHVPVFSGFKTSNDIDGASAALEAARLRYDAERDAKRARVKELARRLAATEKQRQLAKQRARLAGERLRLADLALREQRGSLSDALVARAEADRTARAVIDAELDRVLVWANLEREAGMLATTLVGEQAAAAE
jgi:outer membrane protein TolC